MKNLILSKNIKSDINVFIKENFHEKIIDNYDEKEDVLFIVDTKLRNFLKIKNNIKFIKGGEEAKYLDKYLDLCQTIEKNKFNIVIGIGGGSLMDLIGYTLNTLNHNIKKIILIPTTLTSMIFPPISGFFGIDMNFKRDYLKVFGYVNEVYIDQSFLSLLSKQSLKKQFFCSYILGTYFDSNLSKLSLHYSKNFDNTDLEEFLINSIKNSMKFYKDNYEIPGYNLIKYFIKNPIEINNKFFEIYSSIFLLLSYISYIEGLISLEEFKMILNDTNEFGVFNKKIILNMKNNYINDYVTDIIPGKNKNTLKYFSVNEINIYIDDFINFIRGEKVG
ncbi:hypothetical protein [Tepiditoga spiralis]|uniref:hypothetical protein n=1 Tax=Tepiditoga spiralis TaxID=2108365 RepID=UPI001685A1A9|nr:hypothetical protein [Tepiditoga spiralis]